MRSSLKTLRLAAAGLLFLVVLIGGTAPATAATKSTYVSVVKGSADDGTLGSIITNDQLGKYYGWFTIHGSAKLYNRSSFAKHAYLHWGTYAAVCDYTDETFGLLVRPRLPLLG